MAQDYLFRMLILRKIFGFRDYFLFGDTLALLCYLWLSYCNWEILRFWKEVILFSLFTSELSSSQLVTTFYFIPVSVFLLIIVFFITFIWPSNLPSIFVLLHRIYYTCQGCLLQIVCFIYSSQIYFLHSNQV